MQIVSENYLYAMQHSPYIPKMILDGVHEVPTEAIQKIDFTGGTTAEESGVTLGGTVSGAAVITLDKTRLGQLSLKENLEVYLDLGMNHAGETEWMPMGTYQIVDLVEDDGILTVTANDALASRFDVPYETLEGFDFTAEGGVDARLFLAALCERRGVTASVGALKEMFLTVEPAGYTERQIIGFIAALYGGFADISRTGQLHIRWYEKTDKTVDADLYYEKGMEKASYDFTVGWMKCYVEPSGETLVRGNAESAQGIYFECPWITEEQMDMLWEQHGGFTYRPVTGLELFGDPRLDPGDIVTLKDLTGTLHKVPIMGISHSWDGGIVTSINAKGLAKTDMYRGPTTRETSRKTQKMEQEQKELWEQVGNLIAKKLMSVLENSKLVIDGASLRLFTGENETVGLTNQFDGLPILYMKDYDEAGQETNAGELSPHHLKLGGTSLLPVFYVSASNGEAKLWINGEMNGKTLEWKDNGDGSFTLIGR